MFDFLTNNHNNEKADDSSKNNNSINGSNNQRCNSMSALLALAVALPYYEGGLLGAKGDRKQRAPWFRVYPQDPWYLHGGYFPVPVVPHTM